MPSILRVFRKMDAVRSSNMQGMSATDLAISIATRIEDFMENRTPPTVKQQDPSAHCFMHHMTCVHTTGDVATTVTTVIEVGRAKVQNFRSLITCCIFTGCLFLAILHTFYQCSQHMPRECQVEVLAKGSSANAGGGPMQV